MAQLQSFRKQALKDGLTSLKLLKEEKVCILKTRRNPKIFGAIWKTWFSPSGTRISRHIYPTTYHLSSKSRRGYTTSLVNPQSWTYEYAVLSDNLINVCPLSFRRFKNPSDLTWYQEMMAVDHLTSLNYLFVRYLRYLVYLKMRYPQ